MDNPADYDTDILLWSEKQGRIIRALAARARDLPNDFDIENVAEEIESVGRTEFRAARSLLTHLLEHLIKSASRPEDSAPQRAWFGEIVRFRRDFLEAVSPAMIHRFDLDRIWQSAVLDAQITFGKFDEDLPRLPVASPFALGVLLDESFDLTAAVETLRAEIARLNPASK